MAGLIFALLGLSIFAAAFTSDGGGADPAPEPEPEPEPDLVPLEFEEGQYVVFGTDANEHVIGTNAGEDFLPFRGNDLIDAGGGDDYLTGAGGSDTLNGGDGNDIIDAFTGADVVDGGAGDDTILAAMNYRNDVITTGEGNDLVNIDIDLDDPFLKPAILTDFDPLTDLIRIKHWVDPGIFVGLADVPEITLQETAEKDGTELRIEDVAVAIFQGFTPEQLTDPDTGLPIEAIGIEFDYFSFLFDEFDDQGVVVQGTGFRDGLDDGPGPDTLFGGLGDDTLRTGRNDIAYGEDGDDRLIIDGKWSWGYGGPGDDVFDVDGIGARAFGGSGNDIFDVDHIGDDTVAPKTITTGKGADEIKYVTSASDSTETLIVTDFDPTVDSFSFVHLPEGIEVSSTLPDDVITLELTADGSATEFKLNGETYMTFEGLTPDDLTTGPGGELVPALDVRIEYDTGFGVPGIVITGTDGDDDFFNGRSSVTFLAGEGDDVVDVWAFNTLGPTVNDLGPGDDTLNYGGNGDHFATLGEGNDTVSIKAPGFFDNIVEITDFDPAEDVLLLELPRLGPAEYELSFDLNEDGSATLVRLNGNDYARLLGITPEDMVDPVTEEPIAVAVSRRSHTLDF